MSIQAILLDIDGTLTNSEKKITEKTKQALLKVQESGVRLALASGRPVNGLKKFEKELDMQNHHGILIASNGAEVVDCTTGEVIFQQALSVDQAKRVLQRIKNFEVVPLIAKDEYMYTTDVFKHDITYKGEPFNVMKYECRGNGFLLCEIADLAKWVDFPVAKILTFGNPEYLQQHYKEMKETLEDVNSMFTADFYFEYTAQGVDKTKAIRQSFAKLGYKPEEMMAFGDAQNDKTMIEYVGCGVAMGNASDELKEVADEITLSNDEDGIAESLYKHFPEVFNR